MYSKTKKSFDQSLDLSPRSKLGKIQVFGILPLPYDIVPIIWYKGDKESYLKVIKNDIFFFIYFTPEEAKNSLYHTLDDIKINITPGDESPVLQSIRENSFRSISDLVIGIIIEGIDGISVVQRDLTDVLDVFYQYDLEKLRYLPNFDRYPAYPIIRYKLINDNRAVDRLKLANKILLTNHKKNYIHQYHKLMDRYQSISQNFSNLRRNLSIITNLPYLTRNKRLRDETYREIINQTEISHLSNLIDELNVETKYILEKTNELIRQ